MQTLRILCPAQSSVQDSVDLKSLKSCINVEHRRSVLKWLFESLELLKIEERVFFSSLALADRYCSKIGGASVTRTTSVEGSELQLVILSSLCCSLKTCESSLDMSVKAFMDHISGGHVQSRDIFSMETRILNEVDFDVFRPSYPVFLESFFYILSRTPIEMVACPLEQPPSPRTLPTWAAQQYQLSLFLLSLTAFHVDTFHAVRPPLLISACIMTAAYTLCDQKLDSLEFQTILDALCEAGWFDNNSHDVGFIVRHMSRFWKRAPMEIGEEAYKSVFRIFDTDQRYHVSRLNPANYSSETVTSGG